MVKNSSTNDLILPKNETYSFRQNLNPFFKFPIMKKFNPYNVKFYSLHSGFKNKKDDLLIVLFERAVPVAAIYSKTSTPSAPIIWDKKNNFGLCKVLIVNSGNANAHTGKKGIIAIDKYATVASKVFKCPLSQILVSSTGVIGEQLDFNKIINQLNNIKYRKGNDLLSAAKAIMTTDTFPKTCIKVIRYRSTEIRIFGFAKGSGMIAPNMGTMLAYIFIEANISRKELKDLIIAHKESTFNSITVDGDTSTSDTLMLFSIDNHRRIIRSNQIIFKKISKAVKDIMFNLSQNIISDGEGISKIIEINVIKAKNYKQASSVAFAVGNSLLVKTAIAGQDANWGRIIMAIGKADKNIIQNKIKLSFDKYTVATNGQIYKKINYKKLDNYMTRKKIQINIELGLGIYKRTVFSSDLTHEYVKINADYRS